jgi:hypothetical protein
MSDEIDEFIRRAAERRRQQGQGQKRQQQRPPAQPQPKPKRAPLVQPEIVEAEIVSSEVVENVSSQVDRYLDNRQFENRAAHLGEQPALADDKVEARLHQTFDHQLGRLGSSPLTTARGATDAAAQVTTDPANQMLTFLAKALKSPQEFRQAFILSEILARPADRW